MSGAPGAAVSLTVAVFSRNEERSIAPVLRRIVECVRHPFELLVVDASRDGTPDIVRRFSADHPEIRLVPQRGSGWTAALRTAVETARGEALVVLVADGSDDAADIEVMRELIGGGYDLVCASRYMKGGARARSGTAQAAASRFLNALLHGCLGIHTRDASNSYKMYRMARLTAMQIRDAGYATSMEVTVRAQDAGWRITEIPTTWTDRSGGASKFAPGAQALHYAAWSAWTVGARMRAAFRPAGGRT